MDLIWEKIEIFFRLKRIFYLYGIEIKKFFKNNNLKVIIQDKEYNIIGRVGMYHIVVDITDSDNIEIGCEVDLDIAPLQVNSMIRREYI